MCLLLYQSSSIFNVGVLMVRVYDTVRVWVPFCFMFSTCTKPCTMLLKAGRCCQCHLSPKNSMSQ